MSTAGFKQADIAPCEACGKGLMHGGIPLFYRIRIERFGLDAAAIQRQRGLELMMGGAAMLAAALGPNEDMAKLLDGPRTALICETCSHQAGVVFPVLAGGK